MAEERRRDHRDLIVWQKALSLAVEVYRVSRRSPREETFGLSAQLRRAAVPVPSNIAEGAARRTTRDFAAFLYIARGSLSELETQPRIARVAGLLVDDDLVAIHPLSEEVGRLLNAVISGLRQRDAAARHQAL